MTPRRIVLAAALALTVVFLSPLAYMAGERAGLWITSPAAESGPSPSVDDADRDADSPIARKPAVRPGFGQI
jgi:hypothetical protein